MAKSQNVNRIIWEQLIPTLSQAGLKFNHEEVLKYIDYCYETETDMTYEEFASIGTRASVFGGNIANVVNLKNATAVIDMAVKASRIIKR